MILAGETCDVFKTSQVFGEPTHHDHCGEVLGSTIESLAQLKVMIGVLAELAMLSLGR